MAWSNPGAGVLSRAKSFMNPAFWMQTAVPAVGGYVGTKIVGGVIHGVVTKFAGVQTGIPGTIIRLGSDVLAASGLAWLAGRFLGKQRGDAIFLGGVVGITHTILRELLGGTDIGRAIGLSGLGMGVEDQMREAVARRVEAELSGLNSYLTEDALRPQALMGLNAYLTERDMVPQVPDSMLRASGSFAPGPSAGVSEYDPASERLEL